MRPRFDYSIFRAIDRDKWHVQVIDRLTGLYIWSYVFDERYTEKMRDHLIKRLKRKTWLWKKQNPD